jgi:thiamine biosynthesis lipoprotein
MPHRILALIAGALLFAGCTREPPEIAFSGPTMGTTYSVKVANAPKSVDPRTIQAAIDEVLERIDREMSGYRSDSELSRFNRSTSTDWFEVSEDVVKVVDEALTVAAASQGALDITVAPLVDLWGFGPSGEPAELPPAELVERVRARTGYQKLKTRAQPPALRKDLPDLTLDLNAVAPGFASDLLFHHLTALGLDNVMIDIGGEIRARGRNAKGEAWRIAVEKPVDAEPEPYAIVQLDDMAITTSGEYRHYYVRDGQRYSHTIDPRTGRPVQHALASVVVVSTTALNADAWTTALNVLGETAGYALAAQRNIPAMFIVQDGPKWRAHMTPAFNAYLAVPPDRE